jgi:hypothetical protein
MRLPDKEIAPTERSPSRISVRESPCEGKRLARVEWLDGSWHIALSCVRSESARAAILICEPLQAKFANPAKEDGCAPLDEMPSLRRSSSRAKSCPCANGGQ